MTSSEKLPAIAITPQLGDAEYLPIWTALMGASRGRRFLSEFARRTRAAETRTLLASVQKLERALIAARADRAPMAPAAAPAPAPPAPAGANDAAPRLQAAIAGSLPELQLALRISAGSSRDLSAAAARMEDAALRLRQLAARFDGLAAEEAASDCNAIDASIAEIREIIAVQEVGEANLHSARARLAAASEDSREPAAAGAGPEARTPQHAATPVRDLPEACAPQAGVPQDSVPGPAPIGAAGVRVAAPEPGLAPDPGGTGLDKTGQGETALDGAVRGAFSPGAAPRPQTDEAGAAGALDEVSRGPAVQQLIQEITARLLGANNNPDRPSSTAPRSRPA